LTDLIAFGLEFLKGGGKLGLYFRRRFGPIAARPFELRFQFFDLVAFLYQGFVGFVELGFQRVEFGLGLIELVLKIGLMGFGLIELILEHRLMGLGLGELFPESSQDRIAIGVLVFAEDEDQDQRRLKPFEVADELCRQVNAHETSFAATDGRVSPWSFHPIITRPIRSSQRKKAKG
jgi:hypothetical protein